MAGTFEHLEAQSQQVVVGKQQPTVFLAVEQGFEARYLLRTDIFTTLKQKGARVVILVPNADEDYIIREFTDTNVLIEKLDVAAYNAYHNNSRIQRWLRIMRSQALPAQDDLMFLNDKVQEYRPEQQHPLVKHALDMGIAGLCRSAALRWLLQTIETRIYLGTVVHGHLFDRYHPDLVVTCSPGYQPYDTYLLREARRRGARAAAVIFGWDKSVARGLAGCLTDAIVVWSPTMRDEVVTFQGFDPRQVYVAGVAAFDIYWSKERLYSREELFSHYGLDPNHKLIVFGGKSPRTYPNHAILEILAQAVAEGRFDYPCQLVARMHPNYFKPDDSNPDLSERLLAEYRQIQTKFPGVVTLSIPRISSRKLRVDLHPDEIIEVDSLVWHADVLVTLFSTLLVEACICDTPVVNVAFDPPVSPERQYFKYRPIETDMKQPHNLRVRRSGATRLACTPDQLIAEINAYLHDPGRDAKERARFVSEECGPFDGRAGQRVGEFLWRLAIGQSAAPASGASVQ